MKVFSTNQTKELDRLTIEHEPISSIDLMERVALNLYYWFAQNIATDRRIQVFSGAGNNGGDGLALARMLFTCGYNVEVFYVESKQYSPDFSTNLLRLKSLPIKFRAIREMHECPEITPQSIVVDSLFGSGLSRPVGGVYAEIIERINKSSAKVISIDIPSGLFGEQNPVPNTNPVVNASVCLTLEQPKLSFFMPENEPYIKEWVTIPIGISEQAKNETPSQFFYTCSDNIEIPFRSTFAHKGTYGHLLIIAGCYGMLGAAQLCTMAALRSGVGLTSVHIPKCGLSIFQQSIPEAIVNTDVDEFNFSQIDSIEKYSAICVGPGLGKSTKTSNALEMLLKKCNLPIIIDADALNIISTDDKLWNYVPKYSIITPHVKEFERLFGTCNSGYERLLLAIEMSKKHKIIIILKGAYSQVIEPCGKVHFNSTGNPGMATGGSGDVLSGIVGGLLAQGFSPIKAAITGTFIHGFSGDLATEKIGRYALKSSDIANFVPYTFRSIGAE